MRESVSIELYPPNCLHASGEAYSINEAAIVRCLNHCTCYMILVWIEAIEGFLERWWTDVWVALKLERWPRCGDNGARISRGTLSEEQVLTMGDCSLQYQELFALCQALPGPGSTKMLYAINLIRFGFITGMIAFFIWRCV